MFDKILYNRALNKVSQRYLLVNLISIRVRQLQKGQEPLVDVDNSPTYIDIALQEIAEEKITVKYLESKMAEMPAGI